MIICENDIVNGQTEMGCDINLEGTQNIFKSEFKHSQATPSHVLKESKNQSNASDMKFKLPDYKSTE